MTLAGKQIAVTGATGFLGRYIVEVLRERGAHVIGVVRNPERVPELAARGVEIRRADLAALASLTAAFSGADAVVSNAAVFSVRRLMAFRRRNWEEHQRTNVEGTRNVFEALTAAGVRRVVHVSSVAVYARRSGRPTTEDHPQLTEESLHHPWNTYHLSKALSEQLAWRLSREHGLELTTVRPCGIYGAFDVNFMRAFKRLVAPRVSVFPVCLRLPLVYAGDVAEAIALALERPMSVGKAYNITGEDRDLSEFVEAWRDAGGRTARLLIPIPLPYRQSFDHSRARIDLGWYNRSYADGLRETLALESRPGAMGSAGG